MSSCFDLVHVSLALWLNTQFMVVRRRRKKCRLQNQKKCDVRKKWTAIGLREKKNEGVVRKNWLLEV